MKFASIRLVNSGGTTESAGARFSLDLGCISGITADQERAEGIKSLTSRPLKPLRYITENLDVSLMD